MTQKGETIEAQIRISGKGIGYVDMSLDESLEIDPVHLNTALHRDLVRVLVHPKVGSVRTGQVLEIVKRDRTRFVGVIEQDNGLYFLVPDDQKMYIDIAIPASDIKGAKPGEKVLVEMVKWTDPKKNPLGKVITVIGKAGEHEVEMQTIVLSKGFESSFPSPVEAEAEELNKNFAANLAAEIPNRRDFRQVTTLTIDPSDAKDFDDAISFQVLPDDKFEVGVHIADVAHYVRPGTALDEEAIKRATSIYLVDRTIPMLPEVLSNNICSLVPDQDRLTFGAVFTFDQQFNLVDRWFGRTVIHSARRFSYEEAQDRLTTKTGDYASELETLNKIAYKLRADKLAAGALTFEDEEVKFRLDAAGKPVEVIKKERGDSHKLIEDFMLLANREVAAYVSNINKDAPDTFVYRIHDTPDMERLQELATFLKPLGYKLQVQDDQISPTELNKMLEQASGTPEETMINRATVRAMAKAIYSMRNIGHYGLAFKYYTHFTSPIRRYPDLMVHRLLAIYLEGKKPAKEMLEKYASLVVHASDQEKLAAEAERDSVKYKQVEYMVEQIGKEFDGVISGITEWGIYVEEQSTKAEGMVRLRDLKDDFYEFDEKRFAMVGKKSKKKYRLGDKVKIKVANADLKKKFLDYVFVE